MMQTIKNVLKKPYYYILCPNCESINFWNNEYCVLCSCEFSHTEPVLKPSDLAGFSAIIGSEAENITLDV